VEKLTGAFYYETAAKPLIALFPSLPNESRPLEPPSEYVKTGKKRRA
jgi:hypothetical protein